MSLPVYFTVLSSSARTGAASLPFAMLYTAFAFSAAERSFPLKSALPGIFTVIFSEETFKGVPLTLIV